ncbi:MAG TPA: S8 family peptidase, partial [Herpetosiphonaceae bacterium]|nr:S8 family peptidase [Herpetosiphonaceae bacterium]
MERATAGRAGAFARRCGLILAFIIACMPFGPAEQTVRVIVQGPAGATGAAAVRAAGGQVITDLHIIDAVVARVPAGAIDRLRGQGLIVSPDPQVRVAATAPKIQAMDVNPPPAEMYPSRVIGASDLHRQGITGSGVTIAVIDSGMPPAERPSETWTRVSTNTLVYGAKPAWYMIYKDLVTATPITNSSDPYGHGTHVMATIADGRPLPGGMRPGAAAKIGIAPGANLVIVRALDEQGQAPYSRVIEGIQWIVDNNFFLQVDVLNLSLQSSIKGPYWYDMLNQAVMAAWDAGITVVVAAGNEGPDPMTITAPANVPYVISVGALKPGTYTQSGTDELGRYSSAGPTESKFIKPDVIIAGSRVIAPLPVNSALVSAAGLYKERARLEWPRFRSAVDLNYYYLSGTSMAAAEVSGVVALLLQDEPFLSNDQVKYRLTATARVATAAPGAAAYSVWQQGAGKVSPSAALSGTTTAAANAGMDIDLDRDPISGTHYMGLTEYISDT